MWIITYIHNIIILLQKDPNIYVFVRRICCPFEVDLLLSLWMAFFKDLSEVEHWFGD